MGAVNYGTSDIITLGIKPYDFEETKNDILKNLSDFDLDSPEDVTDEFVDDQISIQYEDDQMNATSIINKYNSNFFNVTVEPGYYEGLYIDIEDETDEFDYEFDDEDEKKQAIKDADNLEKMLKELAGCGFVACSPGWVTGYKDYNETITAIDEAIKELKTRLENTYVNDVEESVELTEAASVYAAKLNQFLDGQSKEVQQFVKAALNAIFMGIKKDYDGYIEGKRATVKDFGQYQTLSMVIQANDVGAGNERGKWSFIDPVKDYCSHLGKIFKKKINGNEYTCVAILADDPDDTDSWSKYEKATDQAQFAMVGCDSIGTGGSYKNLSKEVYGNTYSIVVSVPDILGTTYTNPYMTQKGNVYVFANGTTSSRNDRGYTLTFDAADQEFHLQSSEEGSYDTYHTIYKKSGKALKAFKKLVNTFNANTTEEEVHQFLKDNGVQIEHSWVFNPYYD